MQTFTVTGSRWRGVALLAILGGFGLALALGSLRQPWMLMPLAGWGLLTGRTLWNAARSLASGDVEIGWDGRELAITHLSGQPKLEIESARWIFSNGANIVIAADRPMPKFNSGHVRSNGREMTIDGFVGVVPAGLGDIVQTLGPRKMWLWRYMPF